MIRQMLKKFLDAPRVADRLAFIGGIRAKKSGGMTMPDGAPVPIDVIMKQFGISREAAETIAKRGT